MSSAEFDVGYPIFGAAFAAQDKLVVTGGGGEGNNGIPNKISILKLSGDKIAVDKEYEFPGKCDSPSAMALAGPGTVLVGCNDTTANIKIGENKHLRKFTLSDDEIKFTSAVDLEKSKDPLDYVKLMRASPDGKHVGVLSSKVPSVLRIVDPSSLKEIKSFESKEEIRDFDINDNGDVAFITESNLRLKLAQSDDKEEIVYKKVAPNYLFSKIKFDSNSSNLVLGINLKNKKGVVLQILSVNPESKKFDIIKTKVVSNKFSKITAMTLNNELIALAGNNYSITVISKQHLRVVKYLSKIHSFSITSLNFSPSGDKLISTTAANIINVFEIPKNITKNYDSLIWQLSILLIAVLAYFIKQNISPEFKDNVNYYILYLMGEDPEEFIPSLATTAEEVAPITETVFETVTTSIDSVIQSSTIPEDIPTYESIMETETIPTYESIIETETIPTDEPVIDSEEGVIYEDAHSIQDAIVSELETADDAQPEEPKPTDVVDADINNIQDVREEDLAVEVPAGETNTVMETLVGVIENDILTFKTISIAHTEPVSLKTKSKTRTKTTTPTVKPKPKGKGKKMRSKSTGSEASTETETVEAPTQSAEATV